MLDAEERLSAHWSADRTRISVFAATCVVVLIAVIAMRLAAASQVLPLVNVRWTEGLADATRADIERQLTLMDGERREGATWSYELGDPSPASVKRLIDHAAIEDTYYIDRVRGVVADDAPRSTRVIAGRWSVLRESGTLDWLTTFCVASLLVSGIWLATPSSKRA